MDEIRSEKAKNKCGSLGEESFETGKELRVMQEALVNTGLEVCLEQLRRGRHKWMTKNMINLSEQNPGKDLMWK